MATEADLSAGIDQLNSLVDTLISELQTALNNNANSGAIPNADIQGLLDKVNAERDKVNVALSAGATPTAPVPGTPTSTTGVTEPAPPGSVINADPRATRP